MGSQKNKNHGEMIRFGAAGAGDSFIRYFYPELMGFEESGEANLSVVTDIVPKEEFIKRIENVENDTNEKPKIINAATRLKKRLQNANITYYEIIRNALPMIFKKDYVDALYVATPNDTHRDYVVQGLQRNLHILCEKPLASNLSDVSEMARESMKYDLICMEAAHYIYKPTVQKLRDMIQDAINECGPIKYVDGRILETFDYDAKKSNRRNIYRERLTQNILNWHKGGGITRDTGNHLIAIMQMLNADMNLTDAKLYNYDEKAFSADTAMIAYFTATGTLFEPNAIINLKAAKFCDKKEKCLDIMLGMNSKDRGYINMAFDENELTYTCRNGVREFEINDDPSHKILLKNFIDAIIKKDKNIIETPFGNKVIQKIRIFEDIYNMAAEKNNGTLWRKNKLEFYSH